MKNQMQISYPIVFWQISVISVEIILFLLNNILHKFAKYKLKKIFKNF